MRTVTGRQQQTAGMALGGLGTGSVEILPDGQLKDFHIFNLGKWASANPRQDGMEDLPGYGGDVLPFYIRVKQAEAPPVVRRLSHGGAKGGFRSLMYSWMKSVEEISWTPEFPVCKVDYRDPSLPVVVKCEFISPFVPRDSKISGTPGFYINFTVSNPTDEPLEVSLLGTLKNPVNRGLDERKLQNLVACGQGCTTLTMKSLSQEKYPQNGSISLSVQGGEHSFIQGDFESFLGAHVQGGPFGGTEESCLFDFLETGALQNLGMECQDEALFSLAEAEIEALDEYRLDELLARLVKLPSAARPMRRIMEVSPAILEQAAEKRRFLHMVLNCYRNLHKEFADCAWGGGALCSRFTLQPGERREVRFVLAWHFPNHFSGGKNFVGHRYEKWFSDSAEAAIFLQDNAGRILPSVRDFSELLRNTNAPEAFVHSWSVQLSTLIKCSWWSKKGDFGMWEGYGSCGFQTTDIAYYGTFGLLALFPELELRQTEMTAAFQREDGRIPHFFTPDFETVDEGFDRVDMNPQFVLLVCRDYLWTGDEAFLSRMWGAVVRAMESTALLDGDSDGLPDRDTRANTYDAWRFRGTPAYIAGLWLAALSAAIRMAGAAGDEAHAYIWQQMLEKGRKSFVEKLWNGSYFSLWVDGKARDECCMSGQLDGLWYAQLLGLPPILDKKYIHTAVDSVLRYNFNPESGLINASYPKGAERTLYTHRNVQAEANWSGVEYGFASFLLELGRGQEAENLARAVEERHFKAGRMFNHEECGEYYYRALSSWALMLSLSGLKLDIPAKRLVVSPQKGLTVPWFTPGGCGVVACNGKKMELTCREGTLYLKNLQIEQAACTGVCLDGVPLAIEAAAKENGCLSLRLAVECCLQAGSTFTVFTS